MIIESWKFHLSVFLLINPLSWIRKQRNLLKSLQAGNVQDRVSAAILIGNYKNKRVKKALTKALQDPKLSVRKAALKSLEKLDKQMLVTHCIDSLNGRNLLEREAAAWTLGELGDHEGLNE